VGRREDKANSLQFLTELNSQAQSIYNEEEVHGNRSERDRFVAKQSALEKEARRPGQKSVHDYFNVEVHDPDTEDDIDDGGDDGYSQSSTQEYLAYQLAGLVE